MNSMVVLVNLRDPLNVYTENEYIRLHKDTVEHLRVHFGGHC